MAEYSKKEENKRQKANEWVNQFRPNFENTITRIEKYQERKLFNIEIIALVFLGALFVNLLSNSLYNLSTSFAIQVESKLTIDYIFTAISIVGITSVFFYFRKQLKKYLPQTPVLTFVVKPDDIKPFVTEQRYADIMKFMDEGKLTDFKSFSNWIFQSLTSDFCFLFGIEKKTPIKEYEEEATIPLVENSPNIKKHSDLVTMAKEYDISEISRTQVKIVLQIKIAPKVIYDFSDKGDKTASYSFAIAFHFIIINPDHCDSSKLIEEYYLYKSHEIIRFTSDAISWSFRQIGLEFDYERQA